MLSTLKPLSSLQGRLIYKNPNSEFIDSLILGVRGLCIPLRGDHKKLHHYFEGIYHGLLWSIAKSVFMSAASNLSSPNERSIIRAEQAFMVFVSVFITSWVVTNLIAGRYFFLLGWPLSCGVIIYPVIFLALNIVAEVYGIKRARMLIVSGAVVNVLIAGLIWIANIAPIAPISPVDATSFARAFGLLPGIVLGSLVAYLTAHLVDMYLFESLRKLSNKKYLWLRSNGSALCSQLVDTAMVVTIALVLWPMFDGNEQTQSINQQLWQKVVVSQYFFKGLLALLATPLVYAGVHMTQKWIGSQHHP